MTSVPDWNIIAIEPSIISGKMNVMGERPAPDITIAATIPSTATSMIAGMSMRTKGCFSFGKVGGDCAFTAVFPPCVEPLN